MTLVGWRTEEEKFSYIILEQIYSSLHNTHYYNHHRTYCDTKATKCSAAILEQFLLRELFSPQDHAIRPPN